MTERDTKIDITNDATKKLAEERMTTDKEDAIAILKKSRSFVLIATHEDHTLGASALYGRDAATLLQGMMKAGEKIMAGVYDDDDDEK